MKKLYYIYRNLHKDTFSVRYDGRVIAHHDTVVIEKPIFKVNNGGRQRVLKEGRKNVHAFVAGEKYIDHNWTDDQMTDCIRLLQLRKVSYNPYANDSFVDELGCLINSARIAFCHKGKVWIR